MYAYMYIYVCGDRNLVNSIFDAVNMRGMYPTRVRDSRLAHFYYSTMAEFASVVANRCGHGPICAEKKAKQSRHTSIYSRNRIPSQFMFS